MSIPAEALGRLVREVWLEWAAEQPDPKPSWLVPWSELNEDQREVDRRIGRTVAAAAAAAEQDRIRQLAMTHNAMYSHGCPREDCRNARHWVHFADVISGTAVDLHHTQSITKEEAS